MRPITADKLYGISTFISTRTIIDLAIAFVISTQIIELTSCVLDNAFTPVIQKLFNGESGKEIKDISITILGIKIGVGNIILSVTEFIFIIIILYYMLHLMGVKVKNDIFNVNTSQLHP